MQKLDREVLETSRQWLEEGRCLWHCTIIKTFGSSPRPVGTLFSTDGRQSVGSISGGCLEEHFLASLAKGEYAKTNFLHDYGSVEGVESNLELPCGGSILLLVEYLRPGATWLSEVLDQIDNEASISRFIDLKSSQVHIEATSAGTTRTHKDDTLVEVNYHRPYELILLGATAVAFEVAKLASNCGFNITVVDHRDAVLASWPSCEFLPVKDSSFAYLSRRASLSRSAVLGLAHDPRVDDLGMMVALKSNAFYCGAMGSVRTAKKRRDRLVAHAGLSLDEVQQLKAPIGLDIHSKTPAEIAVSIVAELIKVRQTL